MKSLLAIVLIVGLGYLSGLFLPWYGFVGVAFIVGILLGTKSYQAVFTGFLGMFLLWGGLAWAKNAGNAGLLAGKMGQLFGHLGATGMVLRTAVLAGLLGGFAALTGYSFREAFFSKKNTRHRRRSSSNRKAYARR
jgi:hypothetical protein